MAANHRPVKLVQEEEGFALWKVWHKGRSFFWPEAKRDGRDATGPTDQQIEHHYDFLKSKEEKRKNENKME